jgi:hypothetical protein
MWKPQQTRADACAHQCFSLYPALCLSLAYLDLVGLFLQGPHPVLFLQRRLGAHLQVAALIALWEGHIREQGRAESGEWRLQLAFGAL